MKETGLYTESLYTHTQKPLNTDAFTHRLLYTQRLLHKDAFTHRQFYTKTLYTKTLVRADAFTHTHRQTSRTQRPFHTQMFLHTGPLSADPLCSGGARERNQLLMEFCLFVFSPRRKLRQAPVFDRCGSL